MFFLDIYTFFSLYLAFLLLGVSCDEDTGLWVEDNEPVPRASQEEKPAKRKVRQDVAAAVSGKL